MRNERTPINERFWPKVVKGQDDECWEWMAYRDPNGYGRIGSGGKRGQVLLAHRVAYELLVGPIPDGLTLDHLCRNPPCVNPAHLEPVTQKVNVLRGVSLPAENAIASHCIAGHEFTPDNTYWYGPRRAYRQCKKCSRRRARERYHRTIC